MVTGLFVPTAVVANDPAAPPVFRVNASPRTAPTSVAPPTFSDAESVLSYTLSMPVMPVTVSGAFVAVVEDVPSVRGAWHADRLTQVVSNLVGNAVAHGVGPVRLRVRRASQLAVLEVRNGGWVLVNENPL